MHTTDGWRVLCNIGPICAHHELFSADSAIGTVYVGQIFVGIVHVLIYIYIYIYCSFDIFT